MTRSFLNDEMKQTVHTSILHPNILINSLYFVCYSDKMNSENHQSLVVFVNIKEFYGNKDHIVL